MTLQIRLNGNPIEWSESAVSGDSTQDRAEILEALKDELQEKGWELRSICIDGQPVKSGEFAARLQREDSFLLDLIAVPQARQMGALAEGLAHAVPQFREFSVSFGEALSRGESREVLEKLPVFLAEVADLLAGVQTLALWRNEEISSLSNSLIASLRQLELILARQSWVEGGDYFIYELPLLLSELEKVCLRPTPA